MFRWQPIYVDMEATLAAEGKLVSGCAHGPLPNGADLDAARGNRYQHHHDHGNAERRSDLLPVGFV
jgi:hypothetical protein